MNRTIRSLRKAGLQVEGQVGPDDPPQAADDGLRQFAADEIFFAARTRNLARWIDEGMVRGAGSRYELPVRQIAIS